ncbi:MAG: ATP-binding protein [Desulfobacterales bacterium]|jgi:serine/threonine-protein kinase RsbW
MQNEKTIELSIPNILGFERFAMSCTATYAQSLGFKAERIEDLKTAVAEACINAMQHGNKEKSHERVVVQMSRSNDSFMVSVIDKGEGFTGPMPKDPDIERIVQSLDPAEGFGLFLIKRLVDDIELNQKTDKGHMVRLVFNLPG